MNKSHSFHLNSTTQDQYRIPHYIEPMLRMGQHHMMAACMRLNIGSTNH